MRDPKRIDRILRKLRKTWRKNPDLRLGQLLYALEQNGHHPQEAYSSRARDIFYTEDEVIERGLDTWK